MFDTKAYGCYICNHTPLDTLFLVLYTKYTIVGTIVISKTYRLGCFDTKAYGCYICNHTSLWIHCFWSTLYGTKYTRPVWLHQKQRHIRLAVLIQRVLGIPLKIHTSKMLSIVHTRECDSLLAKLFVVLIPKLMAVKFEIHTSL